MGQLHELLAVEKDLEREKDKTKEAISTVFAEKPNLFLGGIRTLKMFDENRRNEEAAGTGQQEITVTVSGQLKELAQTFSQFWDVKLQKETANQEAKADIEIDGKPFVKDVPVTFLLTLEKELEQVKKACKAIPILQAGVAWERDEQKGEGYWKTSQPVVKNKTEKVLQHDVIVPATKEHPAQVEKWTEDKPVGQYHEETWSAMLPRAEKMALLERVNTLYHAVKKARQRANNQEVRPVTIGQQIFSYLFD